MPILKAKLGEWQVEHLHQWKQRSTQMKYTHTPIISKQSKVVTIGSCFAEGLSIGLKNMDLNSYMHPNGLFYNSATIRQELERIFKGVDSRRKTKIWKTDSGYVDPFAKSDIYHSSAQKLYQYRKEIDHKAETLFKAAEVVIVTLGLSEAWRDAKSKNVFNAIPHPQVFQDLDTEFFRMTVSEIKQDLKAIRSIVKEMLGAELILIVSPVPLHSTFTQLDIQVANVESKGRLRAAVSEFIDENPDTHYFHFFDIINSAEKKSEFMLRDGRHLNKRAEDYTLSEFLKCYADKSVPHYEADNSWQSEATFQTQKKSKFSSLPKEIIKHLPKEIKQLVPKNVKEFIYNNLNH